MSTARDPRLIESRKLIENKQYHEAYELLQGIDDPVAAKWRTQLEERLGDPFEDKPKRNMPVATTAKPKIGLKRFWRNFWGVLTLLACGWITYGVILTSSAASKVSNSVNATSDAERAGSAIGIGLGATTSITFFLCTGLPLFLLAVILYWRNGVAIRTEQRHAEQLNVMRGM